MLPACSRNVLKTSQFLPHVSGTVVSGRLATPATVLHTRLQEQRRHHKATKKAPKPRITKPLPPTVRVDPYEFDEHHIYRPASQGSPLARANLELGKLSDKLNAIEAFKVCQRLKEDGVRPDLVTYNHLLSICGGLSAPTEAWAIFEDMLAMGITPERESFHYLLRASRSWSMKQTWTILDNMEKWGIAPNNMTFEILIPRFLDVNNLESALQCLGEMGDLGVSPSLRTAEGIITCACRLGHPRLALELAEAFEETSVRRLTNEAWVELLIASADALYVDGVLQTWQKAVQELNIVPDEGCCIAVLHVVGRFGLSALGMEVFRVLQNMGVAWEEYHFAPLVEAFCFEGNIKEAFAILELMRSNGIIPVPETTNPIFKVIQIDAEKVDEAWEILDHMHQEGKTVDVTALNVIIQASVALGDLQRAVGTYKAFGDYGVKPTVDTYNLLLSGCIAAQHRDLGDRLLGEMREAGVKPDMRTYERLIILCLTQATYEDAFYYLEEMKSEGFLPLQAVYEAVIRKCVAVGDSRYKLAVDEMLEKGYEMSQRLKMFIDSGGEHDQPPEKHSQSGRVARYKKRQFEKSVSPPVDRNESSEGPEESLALKA